MALLLEPPFPLRPGNLRGKAFLPDPLPPLQSAAQPFHRHLPVARLGTVLRRLHDDAGGEVADPYAALSDIAVLPPRTGSANELYPYVPFVDDDRHAVPLRSN